MEGDWRRLVPFQERSQNPDIRQHQPCIEELKFGLREALAVLVPPKGALGGDDVGSIVVQDVLYAIALVKKTLLGQSCLLGAHLFNARQVCLILLRLIRLLPEPAFEAVTLELVDLAAVVVQQLSCRDVTMMAFLVGDAARAVADVREQPNRLNLFPRFSQQYKERHNEATASTPGLSRAPAGVSLELSTNLRLTVFCRRFTRWMALLAVDLPAFAAASDVQDLTDAMLNLASSATRWARDQGVMQPAEACGIVSSVLSFVHPQASDIYGMDSSPVTRDLRPVAFLPLRMQIRVLEEFPGLAEFLASVPGEDAQAAVGFALEVIQSYEMYIVLPHLPRVLRPFLLSLNLGGFRVFIAAAYRLSSIGYTPEEFWQMLIPLPMQADETYGASEGARLALQLCEDPNLQQQLCRTVQLLGPTGVGSFCRHAAAYWHARQSRASLAANPVVRMCAVLLLSLHNRCSQAAAATVLGIASDEDVPRQLRGLTQELLRSRPQTMADLEGKSQLLIMAMESLRTTPKLATDLLCDGQDFVQTLADVVSVDPPQATFWQAFVSALRLFLAEAEVPLSVKCARLCKLIGSASGHQQQRRHPRVELASWAAVAESLVFSIGSYVHGTGPEEGDAAVRESGKQLLERLRNSLAGDLSPPKLLAIAYALPLLVTMMGFSSGGKGQQARPSLAKSPSPEKFVRLPSAISSPHNILKAHPVFAGQAHGNANGPSKSSLQAGSLYMLGDCAFCSTLASGLATGDQDHSAHPAPRCLPLLPSSKCLKCGMASPLVMRWMLFHPTSSQGGAELSGDCSSALLPQSWQHQRCTLQDLKDVLAVHGKLEEAVVRQLQTSPQAPGDGAHHPQPLVWLLVNSLLSICSCSTAAALQKEADGLSQSLNRLVALRGVASGSPMTLYRAPLVSLLKSDAFAEALLPKAAAAPLYVHSTNSGNSSPRQLEQWRMQVVGFGSLEDLARAHTVMQAADLWSLFSVEDPTSPARRSILELLLGKALMRHSTGQQDHPILEASEGLQGLLAGCSLAAIGSSELLEVQSGPAILRLFEGYSSRHRWVVCLCQLLLKGPLKVCLRSLLPQLMPSFVLARNIDAMRDLSALVKESVQVTTGVHLPFILSSAAQGKADRLHHALSFILEKVYKNQMTTRDLCEASLGKALFLILWANSAPGEGTGEAASTGQASTIAAVGAIATELGAPTEGAPASKDIAVGDGRRKRKAAEARSVGTMLGAATAGSPAKRRATGGAQASHGAHPSSASVPAEVAEVLESNFLPILDILEMLLKEEGDGKPSSSRGSKEASLLYVHALSPGADQISRKHFFSAVKLLFQLTSSNLHAFAPKVFEFLQSACLLSHDVAGKSESIGCWQLFCDEVGPNRLRALVPAVVNELLAISNEGFTKTRGEADGLRLQSVDILIAQVIKDACQADPTVVASLPHLPRRPRLQPAQQALDNARRKGGVSTSTFEAVLEAGVKNLIDATPYAIKSAALETITGLVVAQVRETARDPMMCIPGKLRVRLLQAVFGFLWESRERPADQQRCGELLGAVGAFDPGRVPELEHLSVGSHTKVDDTTSNIPVLARRVLVDHLVPNLGGSNAYAFVVQEILQHLQRNGQADNVLKQLTEDLQQTLSPYKTSSYKLVEGSLFATDQTSIEGIVGNATMMLADAEYKPFFAACLPALPGNNALGLFLLQHVVYHLLKSNTSHRALENLSRSLANLLSSASHTTAQTIFALYDDLSQRREDFDLSQSPVGLSSADMTDKKRRKDRMNQVLLHLTPRAIAEASLRHGSHARALRCLEEAIIEGHQDGIRGFLDDPALAEEDCLKLQEVYRALDDPHGVLGALRVGPATTKTRSLLLEHSRRWHDVVSSYEEQLKHMPRSDNEQVKEQRRSLLGSLVRSTRHTQKFETLSGLVSSLDKDPAMQASLRPYAIEAAWQLSKWDSLDEALQKSAAADSEVQTQPGSLEKDFQEPLGQALMAFHNKSASVLENAVKEARLQATQAVATAARESYTRAYPHLVRLHVLSDIEWLQAVRDGNATAEGRCAEHLLGRAEAMAASSQQNLLSPLRVLFSDMGYGEEAKKMDLALVKLCRRQGMVVSMEHPSVGFADASRELYEKAQLEWGRLLYMKGPRHDALKHMQELGKTVPKAALLFTRWATEAESELLIPRVAEAEFKKVQEKMPDWEPAWFYHAAYLDGILKEQMKALTENQASSDASAPQTAGRSTPAGKTACPFNLPNLVHFTVKGYLQALLCGTKRVHFILNRVLQLTWDCCEVDKLRAAVLQVMTQQAPLAQPWMWYAVLPQLLSRVHNQHTRGLFANIIKEVLRAYPKQAGWHMMQLVHSSHEDHKKLGQEIIHAAMADSEEGRHVKMIMIVSLSLHRLACFTPEDNNASTMRLTPQHRVPELARLVASGGSRGPPPWVVLVPLQRQLTEDIPLKKGRTEVKEAKVQVLGGTGGVSTQKCLEEVTVFRTKDKPKKIVFLGDDGRPYPFLCKQEKRSDLRKDARLMEVGSMLNQMLARNPDARRCGLQARTFSVLSFAESCAIIEWVPGTRTMRSIIDDLWRRLRPGQMQGPKEVKEILDLSKNIFETFTMSVLPRHPPVLHKWFSWKADPSTWLSRRLAFSRSQALWCMLGYIVGLGDRHGENILIDEATGRVVHVDFECLFGKGMTLLHPETVPFRLTQNCVAAMGVTGVEGIFRESCELSLGIMREKSNKQTLLSVLHAFIADPLIDWQQQKQSSAAGGSEAGEKRKAGTETAKHTIADVERKLEGMLNVGAHLRYKIEDRESVLMPEDPGKKNSLLGKDRGVGLSVSGQVDELLKAAMCKRNLSEMYVGWQPWM